MINATLNGTDMMTVLANLLSARWLSDVIRQSSGQLNNRSTNEDDNTMAR